METTDRLLKEYHFSGCTLSFEEYLILRIEVLEERLAKILTGEKDA